MAEQDWGGFTTQQGLAPTDTFLVRTAGGAGMQVPAVYVPYRLPGSTTYTFDGDGTIALMIGHNFPNAGQRFRNLGISGSVSGVTYLDFENESSISTGSIGELQFTDGSSAFNLTATPPGSRTANRRADACFIDYYAIKPGRDNAQSGGTAALRFSTLFAATNAINTSDEREKTWRGAASAAELAAAATILDELGFFQWNDAIKAKGDDARLHFGVRAQRVWAIMAEHGLVDQIDTDGRPGRTSYAFLCFDAWEAIPAIAAVKAKPATKDTPAVPAQPGTDARPAGNRFGVRVDQLNSFLIAALARRVSALEAAA